MQQLNINEVKTHLSGILAQVKKAKPWLYADATSPLLKENLSGSNIKKRPLGLMKKNPDFKIPDDIHEPLPDEILAYFTGEKD